MTPDRALRSLATGLLVTAWGIHGGTAHAQPGAARPIATGGTLPVDPLLRRETLANGVRAWVRPAREPAGRIELRLVIDAGSATEAEQERGTAHLVEHLAFEGTARRSRDSLRFVLGRLGQAGGAHANAVTTADETAYKLTIPAHPEALALALDVLADWAQALPADAAALERQRAIVLEEWRQGRGAAQRLGERQQQRLLAGTPWADRLPIGSDTAIRRLDQATLAGWRARWYRPDRLHVLVVGDVPSDAAMAAIRVAFGGLPRPATPPPAPPSVGRPPAPSPVVVLADPELTARGLSLAWTQPAAPARAPSDLRRGWVATLALDLLARRLADRATRAEAPFTAATVERLRLARPLGLVGVTAAVAPDDPDVAGTMGRTLDALVAEVARGARHGSTDGEVARLVARLRATLDGEARARERIPASAWIDALQAHALAGEPLLDPTQRLALFDAMRSGFTRAAVDSVLVELGRLPPTLVVRVPTRDSAALGPPTAWTARLARAREQPTTPWIDSVASGPWVAPPPPPGRVVAEARVAGDVVEWRLSNGARVWLKTTQGPSELVRVRLVGPGGLSLASDGGWPSALLAAPLVDATGLGRFTRLEVANRLAPTLTTLGVAIAPLGQAVSGAAEPGELETLLQLVHLAVSPPRRDTVAWQALVARQQRALRDRTADPARALADTMQWVLTRGHPRGRPPTGDDLARASLDSAIAFHRARFGDAADLTLVLVGRVDAATARPLVERWIASLPGTPRDSGAWRPRVRWRDVGIAPPSRPTETVVRRGSDPRAEAALVFTGGFGWSPRQSLAVTLLSDVLGGRLQRRLRETMGGTYGVAVQGGTARAPREEATVTVRFAAAPNRIDELSREVLYAVDSLARLGVGEEEFEAVRQGRRRQLTEARRDDRFWLETLSAAAEAGLAPDATLVTDADLTALAPADLKGLAARLLDPRRLHRFTLLPASAP